MRSTDNSRQFKRQTVAAVIVDELRERILSFEIPEGEPLRQDSLAAEFGVSRIPVREALVQLEGEGLVILSAHKGFTVTELSPHDIRDLFDLRALIEVDMLRRAIPRMGRKDVKNARRILGTFDELLEAKTQERDWGRLNWELHSALCAPANRPRAMRILQNLHRHADRYTRLELKMAQRTNERHRQEHRDLVELCAQRNIDAAADFLRVHIMATLDDLMAFLAGMRAKRESARTEKGKNHQET